MELIKAGISWAFMSAWQDFVSNKGDTDPITQHQITVTLGANTADWEMIPSLTNPALSKPSHRDTGGPITMVHALAAEIVEAIKSRGQKVPASSARMDSIFSFGHLWDVTAVVTVS